MRPFTDSTLELSAGGKVTVKGSAYVWKSNAASTSSSKFWGQQGSGIEVTVLDASADNAMTLGAAATLAAIATLAF